MSSLRDIFLEKTAGMDKEAAKSYVDDGMHVPANGTANQLSSWTPSYKASKRLGKAKYQAEMMKALTDSKAPSIAGDAFKKLLDSSMSTAGKTGVDMLAKKFGPKASFAGEMFGRGGLGRKALMVGGMAAAMGAGVSAVDSGVDHFAKKRSKRIGFKDMMDDNPNLHNEPIKDVKRIYSTLHKFNPKVARDPHAAGSFLKRGLMFKEEGINTTDLKTLSEIGSKKQKKTSVLGDAFGTGTTGAAFKSLMD